jgi:hypothetical protein
LNRSDWAIAYGEPNEDPSGLERSGDYLVMFGNGDAWYIERRYDQGSEISAEDALDAGLAVAPTDAELIETYSPAGRPETTVHVYSSQWLKGRFGGQWSSGEPGQFIIVYNVGEDGVSDIKVVIGNNP